MPGVRRAPRTQLIPEARRIWARAIGEPTLLAALGTTILLAALAVAFALLPVLLVGGDVARGVERRLDLAGANFSRLPGFPQRSTIYDRNGEVLANLFLDEDRTVTALEDVAPVARQAVLAIEDDRFYEHGALDFAGLTRALLLNLAAGEITQGGSTITQQLVKLAVIGDTSQTFQRKFQEAALAIRLEERYTKDEILELYLNEVYFGNGVYGIGTASRFYFDVPPSELTLEQAALLAGVIQTPAYHDPVSAPEAARERRNLVLERMGELGWADDDAVEAAQATPIVLRRGVEKGRKTTPPFFVYYLTQSILDMDNREYDVFGTTRDQRVHTLYQGGLEIHTTLDRKWQKDAQVAVNESEDISPDAGVGPDVSIVSIDSATGGIRTMLSGKNYLRDKLDLTWRGRRQVGSAFKAITLAAALEAGVPPTKTYEATSPYCDPRWKSEDGCVRNAEDENEQGPIDLWRATALSVNVVYAQLALDIGAERIVDMAQRLGITAPLDAVPAITLGVEEVSTLDMANAYATLANDGIHCPAYAIDRVMLPDGATLYEHDSSCEQVVDPAVAHQVTAMLERVVSGGTGTRANLGRPVAGKTGTGQDYTNVYFAGYTPQVATAVWVGFPAGNVPMDSYFGRSVFGGTLAAPIWQAYMSKVVAGMPVEDFPPATGLGEARPLPNVVGMSIEEARSSLLAFQLAFVMTASGEKDVILGMSPAPGTVLAPGSVVTLTVAAGSTIPDTVTGGVPNVVGMLADDAIALLLSQGFGVDTRYLSGGSGEYYVTAQSPSAGTAATADMRVLITLERFDAGDVPLPSDPPSPDPTISPDPTVAPPPDPSPSPKPCKGPKC
jgi:penicillin-binding protein 1A